MHESGAHTGTVDEFRIEEQLAHGGVVVLAPYGDIDLYVADELRSRLAAAADGGASALVLDLSEVTFVDSMGLSVLLGGLRRMQADGRELRLAGPSPEVRRLIEITLLDRVFTIDDGRAAALAALGP